MSFAPSALGQIVTAVGQASERFRAENKALREILESQGLTKRQIQRRVNAYLKRPTSDESAHERWLATLAGIERILRQCDASEALAKFQQKGKPQ